MQRGLIIYYYSRPSYQSTIHKRYGNRILCFVDLASLYNLVNISQLGAQFSQYVYFFPLHVSGDYVPIIRRYNCIYATLSICHSVWMTIWYAEWNECFIPSCIPDSHPYIITSTKCRINTVVSASDGHTVARNMQRKEINILRKILHQFGYYLRDYTETGLPIYQQNVTRFQTLPCFLLHLYIIGYWICVYIRQLLCA